MTFVQQEAFEVGDFVWAYCLVEEGKSAWKADHWEEWLWIEITAVDPASMKLIGRVDQHPLPGGIERGQEVWCNPFNALEHVKARDVPAWRVRQFMERPEEADTGFAVEFGKLAEKEADMRTYIGTKIIEAEPEVRPLGTGDGADGYAVIYEGGYRSWSPKDVFEAAYQPLDCMSFGHAIVMLKAGKRVARAGWNGKGMWLAYVKSWAGLVSAGVPSDYEGCAPFIAMFTADKKLVPWLAPQTDMLADDWQVVG